MQSESPLIVLVDDDPDVIEINRHVLGASGYRVLAFSNPRDALERMAQEKPDLVIADLMMDDLDAGFSFSRRIKEDPQFRDTPVIIITAISSRLGLDFNPQTDEDLSAMHADAFLEKPISPELLLAKVLELVGQRGDQEQA